MPDSFADLSPGALQGALPLRALRSSSSRAAMISVVVEELIPESQQHGNTDLGAMGGFAVMMVLDVALG